MCSIHIVYIKNSKVIVCHAEHSLGFKFTTLPCEQLLQTHKSVTFDFIRENDLVQSEATRQASSTPYRLMSTCDWVFPKQTSTPSNSYEDHYEDQREREKNKESNKEWGENVCMCIQQWFPPAPLGANGEETLQTFITEQHAELTTLMAAPVSATSLCSSPLVETHCQMAPNSHSNQSVPTFRFGLGMSTINRRSINCR